MAVKLRLRRMGKKKQPIYKVVAADERAPRDGKVIESIGLYNPLTNPAQVDIAEDRALYWLGVGAQPTNTVKNLLSRKGILLKRELLKEGLDEAKIELRMNEFFDVRKAKIEKKANVKVTDKKNVIEEKKAEVVAENTVSEEEKTEKVSEELKSASEATGTVSEDSAN